MSKNANWCHGSGREPGYMSWSEWSEKTGIQQADGSFVCPDCGRAVMPTYRGGQPAKLARHKVLVN